MLHTLSDIPAPAREKVAAVLSPLLAAAIDLQLHAKHAHWNVKGPSFIALHELFDRVADAAEEAVDSIAERLVQLGIEADGSARSVAAASPLPRYPAGIRAGADHVRALATSLFETARHTRAAIDTTAAAGDAVTADLLTTITASLDKHLWFVEAHVDADR